MTSEKISEILKQSITLFNDNSDNEYNLKYSDSSILFGNGGALDSIGLVNFVVSIEEVIENLTGESVVLGEDIALGNENNPFSTITSLENYLFKLLQD